MTRTVLIVEDDVSLRRNVSYALVEDAYEVIPAGTGGEALGHLRANVIDLILLDVGLPDCCGFSLFHEIRELTKAPVIFMTARTDDRDRIAGLEQGADDYVSKPFAVRELQVRIRNVLRRVYSPAIEIGEKHPQEIAGSPEARPSKNQLAETSSFPVQIDQERQRISFFGTTIHTTRSEFILIAKLASKPGKIFSREDLLDAINVDPNGPYDRSIDGHISKIRNKLKAVNTDHEPIVTHWALGYSLREEWS